MSRKETLDNTKSPEIGDRRENKKKFFSNENTLKIFLHKKRKIILKQQNVDFHF
jgi:hypothetical protein